MNTNEKKEGFVILHLCSFVPSFVFLFVDKFRGQTLLYLCSYLWIKKLPLFRNAGFGTHSFGTSQFTIYFINISCCHEVL
jgi:hypothetical protein